MTGRASGRNRPALTAGPRRALALFGACLAVGLAAGGARAQGTDSSRPETLFFGRPRPGGPSGGREVILQRIRPDIVRMLRAGPDPPLAQQPWVPLPQEAEDRLARARELRAGGMLDQARRIVVELLAGAPHHPQLLSELTEIDVARSDWAAVERLARQERAPHHDSLLLARPLATALERQGKPREAAEIAVQAWLASAESAWVPETLERLAPTGAAVREALRAAVARAPARTDMVVQLASLDWKGGAGPQALKDLAAHDGPEQRPPLRMTFSEDLLKRGTARDSSGATEALLSVAEDERIDRVYRIPALQRAWSLLVATHGDAASAPRVAHDLQALSLDSWSPDLVFDVTRALRRGGHTAEARDLLGRSGQRLDAEAASLERALTDLRDGPPERALPALHAIAGSTPEAGFRYAEALFFSGQPDSALNWYQRVARDPSGAWTGAALERMFLIEDAQPAAALPVLGHMAWEEWRGEPRQALAVAESLVRVLPPGPLWAHAGLELSRLREAAGDVRGALAPVLAIADSLPGDRLAPVARQRAGDLYLDRLHDERAAVAQYEECLARYPRAWNAAEVRRRLETLRRDRRF